MEKAKLIMLHLAWVLVACVIAVEVSINASELKDVDEEMSVIFEEDDIDMEMSVVPEDDIDMEMSVIPEDDLDIDLGMSVIPEPQIPRKEGYHLTGSEEILCEEVSAEISEDGNTWYRSFHFSICGTDNQEDEIPVQYTVWQNEEKLLEESFLLGKEGAGLNAAFTQIGTYQIDFAIIGWNEIEEEEQVFLNSFTGENQKEIWKLHAKLAKDTYSYRDILGNEMSAEAWVDSTKNHTYQYQIEMPENKVVTLPNPFVDGMQRIQLYWKGIGVGETTAHLKASSGTFVEVISCTLPISIEQSGMQEDVRFTCKSASGDIVYEGKSEQELQHKLEETGNWLNGSLTLSISEESQRWFHTICVNHQEKAEDATITFHEERDVEELQYWLTNEETAADTSKAENGIGAISFGIDKTAPEIVELSYGKHDFKPARENTKAYYPENFMITGSCRDDRSGVSFVEYSIGESWITLENTRAHGDKGIDFELELSDGSYPFVAFRVYDLAGNCSETFYVTNAEGETMSFVVDREHPVLELTMTSQEKEYLQKWTNQDIALWYQLAKPQLSGLYKVQYQYKSILDDTDLEEKDWKDLDETFLCSENRNGYVYVRGISNAGLVTTKEAVLAGQKRILLQKTLPEPEKIIEENVEKKRKNEWFNKSSGVPVISFAYPKYDTGVNSKEYGAPITIHTEWKLKTEQNEIITESRIAGIDEKTQDDIEALKMDFSWNNTSRYARDGIYSLQYWIEDEAGNRSEIEERTYCIDTHEPVLKEIVVGNHTLSKKEIGESTVYEAFFQTAQEGSFGCEPGVSGEDIYELTLVNETRTAIEHENHGFTIRPGMRGSLELKAEDLAGNISVFEVQGVVADEEAPAGHERELLSIPDGANEFGFYNQDFVEDIICNDMPQNSFSSLKTVSFVIGNEEHGTILQEMLLSEGPDALPEQELLRRGSLKEQKKISAQAVESNHVYAEVEATDYCGNKFVSRQQLKVDVTKPVVELTFSNEGVQQEKYYNSNQYMDIAVIEKNFSEEVQITVIKNGEPYAYTGMSWKHEGDRHYGRIEFCEDGTFQVQVSAFDLADNASEEVISEEFVIDKTGPVLELKHLDQPYQENYYPQTHRIEIAIEELNFYEEGFAFDITGGAYRNTPWTVVDGKYICQFIFEENGAYQLQAYCMDRAGNVMDDVDESFVIDTMIPKVSILGVENDSANKGEVFPRIVIEDENFNPRDVDISLRTGLGETIVLHPACQTENGFCYDLKEINSFEDQIYYLQVSARDLAGNQNSELCRFSLNRLGSTYDLSKIEEVYTAKYLSFDAMPDLEITEYNFDPLEESRIYLSKDGLISCLNEEEGYTCRQSGDDLRGYQYTYVIPKENFQGEGYYRIFFYSRDSAGNEVNSNLIQKNAQISFVMDNTCPSVLLEGIETQATYQAEEKNARILVQDNYGLSSAKIHLLDKNHQILQTWDYLADSRSMGEALDVSIRSADTTLSLAYEVTDYAGNRFSNMQEPENQVHDFLITTNVWLAFWHRSKSYLLLAACMAGGLLVLAAVVFCVWRRKRKV